MPHQCPRRIINEKTRLKSGRVKSSKDRYMQFLHRSNAELCVQMARTAKSVEIRQQWEELAKCWQAKAEAEERHAESVDVVAAPAPPAPGFRRAAVEDQNGGKPEPKSDPVVAPALPDLASSPITPDKEPQPEASDDGLNVEVLDDQWTRLIEAIRAK